MVEAERDVLPVLEGLAPVVREAVGVADKLRLPDSVVEGVALELSVVDGVVAAVLLPLPVPVQLEVGVLVEVPEGVGVSVDEEVEVPEMELLAEEEAKAPELSEAVGVS